MRTRSVSTLKSGRISGQGFRSGSVAFFVRLAHATRENSARQTAVRISATRQRARQPLSRSRRRRDVILVVERVRDIDPFEPAVVRTARLASMHAPSRASAIRIVRRPNGTRSDRQFSFAFTRVQTRAQDARMARCPPSPIAHCIPGDLRQAGGAAPAVRAQPAARREILNEYARVYRLRARHAICSLARVPAGVIGCMCRRPSDRPRRFGRGEVHRGTT